MDRTRRPQQQPQREPRREEPRREPVRPLPPRQTAPQGSPQPEPGGRRFTPSGNGKGTELGGGPGLFDDRFDFGDSNGDLQQYLQSERYLA